MPSGAIMANSGHFDCEINVKGLEEIKTGKRKIRDWLEEYSLPNNKKVYLLGEGRLVNLAAEYLVKNS